MGTTEFVIAGLLPEIAGDLGVGVSHAGLVITTFALGMIVGGPTMALATLRLPHRLTGGEPPDDEGQLAGSAWCSSWSCACRQLVWVRALAMRRPALRVLTW